MRDCFTCEYAERDNHNRFIGMCLGSGNCSYVKFEGEIESTISEMTEKEFDDATKNIFQTMRKQYPSMCMGDFQTIMMFSKIFKEKYLK